METGESGTQRAKTYEESKKLLDEAWKRSAAVYKEAKEQADIIHEAARKIAPDKDARKRADEAHEEALKEAKKVRDAITNVAQTVFTDAWAQRDAETKDAGDRSKEHSDLAEKTYREAKDRAAATHREAKTQAVDKQAVKAADQARKEAERQAKQAYDEAMKK